MPNTTGRAAEISNLDKATRLNRLAEIGKNHGYYKKLSKDYSALFVEESDTLVVSFDTTDRLHRPHSDGLPLGFAMVEDREVSLLSILGTREGWFRDPALYAFFDDLVDDGFFDHYDRIVFLGLGPMCGYAALAYSVVAPGAQVIATNPVATLDRSAAPFERRFKTAWRRDFTTRYGYAPLMVEAAQAVTLLYDPTDVMAAAHSALFQAPNVARYKLRHGSGDIGAMLMASGGLWRLVDQAINGRVTSDMVARVARKARRNHAAYIMQLTGAADQSGHPKLALAAARYGKSLVRDGRFDEVIALLGQRSPA